MSIMADHTDAVVRPDSRQDVLTVVAWFKATFKVDQLENRFVHPTAMGWRDVTLILTLPLTVTFLLRAQESMQVFGWSMGWATGDLLILRCKFPNRTGSERWKGC